MVFVTFIIIVAILLVYADDRRLIKNGMLLSFFLIVIVFSLRYGYANDYFNYEKTFKDVSQCASLSEAIIKVSEIEVGWVIISYISKPFGFQFSVFLATLTLCYVYYYLINKYVPRPYRWFGVFIFLMHPNLFLLDLAMIRQGLAAGLVFLAFCKGYENKTIQSLLIFIIAPSLHLSAWVCIPIIILINLNRYIKPKYIAIGVIALFLLYFIIPDISGLIVNELASNDVVANEYSSYFTSAQVDTPTSITKVLISRIVILLPSLLFFLKLNNFDKYLTIMTSLIPFVIVMSTQNYMFLRMEYYLLPFYTLLFPRLVAKNSPAFDATISRNPKYICLGACVFLFVFIVHSFFNFFDEPSYSKAYATYHTVLSLIF